SIWMASDISIDDQYLWVANRRLSMLVDFALEIADQLAKSDTELAYVAELRNWDKTEHCNGCGFSLDERFPTVEHKKFWARVFFDTARAVFDRKLGNQDIAFWQCSTIGDCYVVGRMLCYGVRRDSGSSWFPETINASEHTAFFDRIDTKL
ncbi:MAG: hypothetical protein AAF716_20680, partial [Cyanobacteria bacterium P01_D01_bin.1]